VLIRGGLVAEFTVEPFVEGRPGPHVQAALDAAAASGLPVEFGPFGTSVSGPADAVSTVIAAIVRAATEHGATTISIQVRAESSERATGAPT
jgi:uncharacterized protein YqgV (UPF0045/DUF77 family)